MTDKKITISRSFSRKKNLGNYESADFFSCRSMDVPLGTSMAEQEEVARELHLLAMQDVTSDIMIHEKLEQSEHEELTAKEFREIEDKIITGEPIQMEAWDSCTPIQQKILNHFKKYYKRSEAYKSTLKERT